MRHHVTLDAVFPLEGGGTLSGVQVEVRTWGRHRPNSILICHALTGSADADDWWSGLFGAGKVFDPSVSFIVSMNVLGSVYGTTGPTSLSRHGEPYAAAFPEVTIRDMVHLQRLVLEQLGVDRLDLVIGGSMGGMQALEWAAMYPELVDAIVPIGVGATQSAWAVGWSETQRHAILSDPAFEDGWYRPGEGPVDGLATARMIAMVSYRSPGSFDARFGRSEQAGGFAVQSYLRHQGSKLVDRFDANAYLTLMGAMDSHDLGRGRGPIEGVLRHVEARALVVGISSDVLYPVAEVRALADALPNGQFAVLDTPHGHDGFLIALEDLNRVVTGFLTANEREAAQPGRGSAWA
ncbi:MAG: homoserine O-acetyltransferase [Acidimicrobiia bacterium]|nr:homoserine O-acetyltransferase [Acidimicrobiia bacterium]